MGRCKLVGLAADPRRHLPEEMPVIAFQVNDMTCGHCVGAVTKAVQTVDPQAQVQVDLASHRIEIRTQQADAAPFDAALRDAGYTPAPA